VVALNILLKFAKFNYYRKSDIPAIQKIFPNSNFEWLDAGHWVHAEKSEDFINLVVKFLNE
jgi:esterase